MKNVAILQARCSSSRLPGKVLKNLIGRPMIWHQIERIKKAELIDDLIIATSVESSDDPLYNFCKESNIKVYRGNLNDVLDRFFSCIKDVQCDNVIRLTADCPLTDHQVIDKVIASHLESDADYTSNCLNPSYPDGLDVEIIKKEVLKIAWEKAEISSEREHVTPFIYNRKDEFKINIVKCDLDLSSLRWTVDEAEDFEFVENVYKELYDNNNDFLMNEILSLIKQRPELQAINCKFMRNEGLLKSLNEEK